MKKFTGVILGVLILCSASVANAANEHSEKTEHFSMLELSALILEKYPNAHIDSDAFSINACDSHFTKDASVDNHSCLDSPIKPRADSADFALRLSVGVDLTQTQRMIFTPEAHIVSKAAIGKRYDFKLIPERLSNESPEVTHDSWTYSAYNKLVAAGVVEQMPWRRGPSLMTVTRFEFAYGLALLLDKKTERTKDSVEEKELIAELAIEFAPEIAYLLPPVEPSDVPIGGTGSWPYDAINQLNFLGVKADVSWAVMGTTKPLTRYEFAVAIARLLDKKDERAKDSQKIKILIAKLALEFEPELSKLNYPIDHNKLIKELADAGLAWQSRYVHLQLDLTSGNQFDPKLRQQIENTIADYAATWLKLNSSSNVVTTQK